MESTRSFKRVPHLLRAATSVESRLPCLPPVLSRVPKERVPPEIFSIPVRRRKRRVRIVRGSRRKRNEKEAVHSCGSSQGKRRQNYHHPTPPPPPSRRSDKGKTSRRKNGRRRRGRHLSWHRCIRLIAPTGQAPDLHHQKDDKRRKPKARTFVVPSPPRMRKEKTERECDPQRGSAPHRCLLLLRFPLLRVGGTSPNGPLSVERAPPPPFLHLPPHQKSLPRRGMEKKGRPKE